MSLVKVKILKFVGHYVPGQIVEVSEEQADHLCKPSHLQVGEGLVEHLRAMRLEEAEALDNAPVDPAKMTAKELADKGLKNVVATPVDPAFKAKLESLKKPAAKEEEIPEKKAKAGKA